MKKQLAIATGVMLLSTGAFATKTRLNALGQGSEKGSFYMNDTRNVFRNAAVVNSMNNYVVTEWGGSKASATTKAEGGFFKSAGNFNYGVYLGSDINSHDAQRATGGTGYAGVANAMAGSFLASDNEVDLFFGGDMGLQWGANLHYAASKDETTGTTEKKHSALGLGVGVIVGDMTAALNFGLKDESEFDGTTAGTKFENDGDMSVAATYALGATTFYADYSKLGFKYNNGTQTFKSEKSTISVGAGHIKEVSNTARLNMDLTFVSMSAEDTTVAGVKTELDRSTLPLTVGFEVDANSWLVFRGSITQNFIIGSEETKTGAASTKKSMVDSADVRAGATLNFGKLKVDGTIGTTGFNRAGTKVSEEGVLATDNLMTEVAVHYWF